MVHEIKISGFNRGRGEDELIIYEGASSTGTNAYGFEIAVSGGKITAMGGNNRAIPEGGFVISGHGKSSAFLKKFCLPEANAEICREKNILYIKTDDETQRAYFFSVLKQIQERAGKSGADITELISQINAAINGGEDAAVYTLLDKAYCASASPKKGEVRAVWHRPLEHSAAQVDALVKRFADGGINLILIEAIYDGHSVGKKCTFMPQRADLVPLDVDITEEFIKAGKKYGVEIHAWIENFFVGSGNRRCEGCGSPIIDERPEWAARKKDGTIYMKSEPAFIYLNAALPEVRFFLRDMYKEMLDNYDFDGIQLDYIRYPLTPSVDESVGFDDFSVKTFFEKSGIDIREVENTSCEEWKKFILWRAENVTEYVKLMHALVGEYKNAGRKMTLSAAVFGDPDEAVRLKSQNWELWCKNGWFDNIYPMAYLDCPEDIYNEVKYMVDNYGNVPNISGICPMYKGLAPVESVKQVEACREAGAAGVAFFETKTFNDLHIEALKMGAFKDV